MIVEDEPITAADLEQKLTALGHEVVASADTGEDAVRQAEALGPDLILMDVRLGGPMDGIEAAQRLRRRDDVAVVFLTAFSDQATVDRACQALPFGYLLKPFSERSVTSAVQVALSRAAATRAQRERERWLSEGLRSAGEALLAVDQTGTLRFLNEQAEAMLHVQADQVLGGPASAIIRFDPEDGTPNQPLEEALRAGIVSSAEARVRIPAMGDAALRISYSAAPTLSSAAKRTGAVLLFREAGAAETARIESALNALSMRLSHEINNPLTYNLGALRLALAEVEQLRRSRSLSSAEEPAQSEREQQLARLEGLLRDAQEGASRIARVMGDLSSHSLSEHALSTVSLSEILELALGLAGFEAAQRARLVPQVRTAPAVAGDKWQLAHALVYVLRDASSALDARHREQNVLTVSVDTDAKQWAEIRAVARGVRAPGASATRSQPASDATSSNARDIALAQHVVAHYGGELVARDEPDARVVVVRLPPTSPAPVESEPVLAAARRRLSLLIIDDEPLIRRVLDITLQPDLDVTTVPSAETALGMLERGDSFDAILCDLSMPRMSGQDFYERLCASRPDLATRVIIMTGGAPNERGARFVKQMGQRCLIKPFSIERLMPLIEERVRASEHPSANDPPC